MKKRGLNIKFDDGNDEERPLDLLIKGIIVVTIIGFWVLLFWPGHVKARAQEKLTTCKRNHKELATALEMYASDNQGRYPGGINSLTAAGYLKTIPTCPIARLDTYSPSYQVQSDPDEFSFCCTGNNHAPAYTAFSGNNSGFPQYNSIDGLIDHP